MVSIVETQIYHTKNDPIGYEIKPRETNRNVSFHKSSRRKWDAKKQDRISLFSSLKDGTFLINYVNGHEFHLFDRDFKRVRSFEGHKHEVSTLFCVESKKKETEENNDKGFKIVSLSNEEKCMKIWNPSNGSCLSTVGTKSYPQKCILKQTHLVLEDGSFLIHFVNAILCRYDENGVLVNEYYFGTHIIKIYFEDQNGSVYLKLGCNIGDIMRFNPANSNHHVNDLEVVLPFKSKKSSELEATSLDDVSLSLKNQENPTGYSSNKRARFENTPNTQVTTMVHTSNPPLTTHKNSVGSDVEDITLWCDFMEKYGKDSYLCVYTTFTENTLKINIQLYGDEGRTNVLFENNFIKVSTLLVLKSQDNENENDANVLGSGTVPDGYLIQMWNNKGVTLCKKYVPFHAVNLVKSLCSNDVFYSTLGGCVREMKILNRRSNLTQMCCYAVAKHAVSRKISFSLYKNFFPKKF